MITENFKLTNDSTLTVVNPALVPKLQFLSDPDYILRLFNKNRIRLKRRGRFNPHILLGGVILEARDFNTEIVFSLTAEDVGSMITPCRLVFEDIYDELLQEID